MDKNKYFYNYEEDLVVREDENGERFFKTLDNLNERPSKNKASKAIWGIPSYGILNVLHNITKEQYETFGIEWEEISLETLNSKFENALKSLDL